MVKILKKIKKNYKNYKNFFLEKNYFIKFLNKYSKNLIFGQNTIINKDKVDRSNTLMSIKIENNILGNSLGNFINPKKSTATATAF